MMSKFKGLSTDSRKVSKDYIFFAIKGTSQNGEDFIDSAIANGATKIVVEKGFTGLKNSKVPYVEVSDIRDALANVASTFYPNKPKNIVALTGTNGKTTVAFLFKQICENLGHKSASIGTLGIVSNFAEIQLDEVLTSPDPITLHRVFSDLKKQEVDYVCLEASSHGLVQKRLEYIPVKAAAFTNFTQDHLDYHQTMEAYLEAKLHIFDLVVKSGTAVVNADIPEYVQICNYVQTKRPDLQILSFGKAGESIKLIDNDNKILRFQFNNHEYNLEHELEGSFAAENLMAVIGLCVASNISVSEITRSSKKLKAAPGRLEKVGEKNGAQIFIDYAHTPDALEKAILSLRAVTKNKLKVIFGCGGDRDAKKRPIMGEIADKLADIAYVTDDNPRTEDAKSIRGQVIGKLSKLIDSPDRAKCIYKVVQQLEQGDVLLIAGKGHETYQIIGKSKIYFSDVEEVMKSL